MKHIFLWAYVIILLSTMLNAQERQAIENVAKACHLYGGQRATVQWKRIFSSPRHLKRYKLDTLPPKTRKELEFYLINHAADSDQPIVPGL